MSGFSSVPHVKVECELSYVILVNLRFGYHFVLPNTAAAVGEGINNSRESIVNMFLCVSARAGGMW